VNPGYHINDQTSIFQRFRGAAEAQRVEEERYLLMSNIQPHILATSDDVTPFALLPGDPARVHEVARHLSDVKEISRNREFLLIRGQYKNTPVTAMSTGMGGVSVAIGIEELARCGVRYGIRIGSAGALQDGIRNGSLVVAEGAVRDEGTTQAYVPLGVPAIPAPEVYQALLAAGDALGIPLSSGLIRSHDSFYRDDEDEISAFWHARGVLAAEMESAALFIVGSLRGVRTGSVLNIVVEYGDSVDEGIGSLVDAESQRKEGELNEIMVGLEALYILSNK
jgi:uridine phosphorylase